MDQEVHATAGREAGATGSRPIGTVQSIGNRFNTNRQTALMRFFGTAEVHPIDEDLSLHPSEQKSLSGDPESMGAPKSRALIQSPVIEICDIPPFHKERGRMGHPVLLGI